MTNRIFPDYFYTMGPKVFGFFLIHANKKSDNLQYNKLGRWVDLLIDQGSDGPSIILMTRARKKDGDKSNFS